MPFPMINRVVYKKNPLEQVICQLRFPPILKIDSELPSEFQDIIREKYPIYEERLEVQHEFSGGFNFNSPIELVNPMSKVTSSKNHVFTSEDGEWQINLTRTFVSISTSKYRTWEDFKERFRKPLEALISVYAPPFFVRVGLRYIDVFCKDRLGLSGSNWSELIQPHFLGILASEVKEYVGEYNSVCEIKLDDGISSIRVNTSLVKSVENEECFMLDSDAYTPIKIEAENVIHSLDYIHERSSRLVRFAITDKLHNGMEPVEI
jgi:uncharacterized protein (TIGR04255 family)